MGRRGVTSSLSSRLHPFCMYCLLRMQQGMTAQRAPASWAIATLSSFASLQACRATTRLDTHTHTERERERERERQTESERETEREGERVREQESTWNEN